MFQNLRTWLVAAFINYGIRLQQAKAAGKLYEPVNEVIYLLLLVTYVVWTIVLALHYALQGFMPWLVDELLWAVVTALSVGMVGKDQRALIWFLNTPAFEWPSWLGVYFAPFGITSVTMIPKTVFERELPDDPEWIFYGRDDEKLPERIDPETGKMRQLSRVIRITTGGEMEPAIYKALRSKNALPTDAGPSENLNYLMTVAQNMVLRYVIENGFYFYIRSKGKTLDEKIAYVEKEMADFAVKVLKREYIKYSIGGVLIMHPDIEERALTDLGAQVATWGIKLEQTVIKPPDLTHDLNKALAAKPIASANAQAAAMDGTGEGHRQGNIIRGVSQGEKDGADTLGMTAQDMRLIDKGAEMMKDNAKIVLGTAGFAEALGVGEVLRKIVPSTTTPTPIPTTPATPPPVAPPATNTTTNGGTTP